MMKYSVDFSIFSSPTEAFGDAEGEIDFVTPPFLGQAVDLVNGTRLKITSISAGFEGWVGNAVGLDDIVFESKEEAREFARRLEAELDFFVVPYHDD